MRIGSPLHVTALTNLHQRGSLGYAPLNEGGTRAAFSDENSQF